jgi:hypothetical protein
LKALATCTKPLTPGDFAAGQQRVRALGVALTSAQLIDQLASECQARAAIGDWPASDSKPPPLKEPDSHLPSVRFQPRRVCGGTRSSIDFALTSLAKAVFLLERILATRL